MFDTRYRAHKSVTSVPGEREKVTYTSRVDKEGRIVLEPSGKEDVYGYIQSFRDSVDIHKIMERFTAGDPTALSRAQGFYADITDAPSNFAEMLNLVQAGREAFDSMPAAVKEQFDNSFEKWLVTSGSADWLQKMQLPDETKSKMPTPEPPAPVSEGE